MNEFSYAGKEKIINRIIEEFKNFQKGNVNDVTVNGETVVNQNGIAEVTVPTKLSDMNLDIIHIGTTEYWNSQLNLIGEAGNFYIYTDHDNVDGRDIPGMKIGDGLSYLIDNQFIDSNVSVILEHISDDVMHVTQEEKDKWNAKVRCYIDDKEPENFIFTTD